MGRATNEDDRIVNTIIIPEYVEDTAGVDEVVLDAGGDGDGDEVPNDDEDDSEEEDDVDEIDSTEELINEINEKFEEMLQNAGYEREEEADKDIDWGERSKSFKYLCVFCLV